MCMLCLGCSTIIWITRGRKVQPSSMPRILCQESLWTMAKRWETKYMNLCVFLPRTTFFVCFRASEILILFCIILGSQGGCCQRRPVGRCVNVFHLVTIYLWTVHCRPPQIYHKLLCEAKLLRVINSSSFFFYLTQYWISYLTSGVSFCRFQIQDELDSQCSCLQRSESFAERQQPPLQRRLWCCERQSQELQPVCESWMLLPPHFSYSPFWIQRYESHSQDDHDSCVMFSLQTQRDPLHRCGANVSPGAAAGTRGPSSADTGAWTQKVSEWRG